MSVLCPSLQGEIVASDGKTACASRERDKSTLHMVSALVCNHGITLGRWTTHEKSNEITTVPALIETLDLEDATVALDAMGCQKAITRMLADKGADTCSDSRATRGHYTNKSKG